MAAVIHSHSHSVYIWPNFDGLVRRAATLLTMRVGEFYQLRANVCQQQQQQRAHTHTPRLWPIVADVAGAPVRGPTLYWRSPLVCSAHLRARAAAMAKGWLLERPQSKQWAN